MKRFISQQNSHLGLRGDVMGKLSNVSKSVFKRLLAFTIALAIVATCFPISAAASNSFSYTDDNGIEYLLNPSKKTAVLVDGYKCLEKSIYISTVSYDPDEEDDDDYDDDDYDDDDAKEGDYAVVSIAKNAFKENAFVQDITIDGCCKTIGNSAFREMANLKKVSFGTKLSKINFDGVKLKQQKIKVGHNAFVDCKKLREVYTSSQYVTSIGKNAFKGTKKGMTVLLAVYTKNYKKKKEFDKVAKKQISAYKKLLKNTGAKSVKFQAETSSAPLFQEIIYSY